MWNKHRNIDMTCKRSGNLSFAEIYKKPSVYKYFWKEKRWVNLSGSQCNTFHIIIDVEKIPNHQPARPQACGIA